MAEIAGAVESLVVYRQKAFMSYDFHIHWKATNGKMGCHVKTITEVALSSLRGSTLARVGLSEQALTGDPRDDGVLPKIILNFQRETFDRLLSSLDLSSSLHVVATLPGGRHTIEIPVSDHSFTHDSINPSHIADEDESIEVLPGDLPQD